jgi:thiamine transport system ATP-binding protein
MLCLKDVVVQQDDFRLQANFDIPAGRRVAVLGPSGAGKSTLLSVLGGYLATTSGRVLWQQADITDQPPSQRPIATVFQDNNLFPHMTAIQNVGLGIKPSLKLSPKQTEQVDDALRSVGLGDFGQRRPAALSGGQQSRVALARLLVQQKPLILLDEPFSALGPSMRSDMVDLARDIGARTGATLLMVSHDIKDVEHFADDVIWVEKGTCQAPRPLADFLNHPPQGFKDYVGY